MYTYFKKHSISAFYNKKLKKSICSKGGKIGSIVWKNKRRKLGLKPFPMSKQARRLNNSKAGKIGGKLGGKAGTRTQMKNKIGIFGFSKEKRRSVASLAGKMTAIKHPNHSRQTMLNTHKKYPNLSKQNAMKSIKTMRMNIRAYKYKSNFYDSRWEAEIAICIEHQFDIELIENQTIHVRVGYLEYDFLINDVFVEYHPTTFGNGSLEDYYIKRRKNLNTEGYSEYELVVI